MRLRCNLQVNIKNLFAVSSVLVLVAMAETVQLRVDRESQVPSTAIS